MTPIDTPFHNANNTREQSSWAANRGHKAILELMIRHGLDINHPHNRFGASIAEFAIHKDSVEWLEYFFQLGVPVNALDGTGHSLLEIAAGGGNLKCLAYLRS